ncbi:procathepsin L-like [Engraulis encrasicolus]|uniref:procathepsin L-like n=1 Tax=Engraulis encrasicolus TaxID=184585 RepID=UPI002FD33782
MKLCIIAAACLAVVSCASISLEDLEFHAWKLKFGKVYESPEEEAYRKNIWLSSRRRVLAHNILADQGIHTYRRGMNQFSDMDEKEYRLTLHEKQMTSDFLKQMSEANALSAVQQGGAVLPHSVDWRNKGCVSRVRQQGPCASCWAFSAVSAVESHTCIKHKKPLTELSVQQLVDCAWPYGTQGCRGGWTNMAFDYMQSKGLVNETDYPYRYWNFPCHFPQDVPRDMIAAKVTGFLQVPPGDESALKDVVAKEGPVTVSVDARHISFKDYTTGVYHESACSSDGSNPTHVMLVVGYGTDVIKTGSQVKRMNYWLVKNSWDVTWGDQGYIKMARDMGNNCGIASYAVYPTV